MFIERYKYIRIKAKQFHIIRYVSFFFAWQIASVPESTWSSLMHMMKGDQPLKSNMNLKDYIYILKTLVHITSVYRNGASLPDPHRLYILYISTCLHLSAYHRSKLQCCDAVNLDTFCHQLFFLVLINRKNLKNVCKKKNRKFLKLNLQIYRRFCEDNGPFIQKYMLYELRK